MKFVPLTNPNQLVPGCILFLKDWTLSQGNPSGHYPVLFNTTDKVFVIKIISDFQIEKNNMYTAIFVFYKEKQYFTFISNDREFNGELEVMNI